MKMLKLKTLLVVGLLSVGLVGVTHAEKLGTNYKPTKYKAGDKFHGDFGIWELIEFVPVSKDYIDYPEELDTSLLLHRWRIKIHSKHAVADAWTDDHWLDKLKRAN